MKTTLCFRLILILVLLCAGYANATNVSGIIGADTTWTLANSPYIVVGNILVDQGVTLTVEPGVTVKFNQDLYLYVDGTLIAPGTESNMITFTSNQASPTQGDWQHIKFRDSAVDATFDEDGNYVSGCILEYCKVEWGSFGIWVENTSAFIGSCTVINNNIGIMLAGDSGGIVSNCIVSNCTITSNRGGGGIFLAGFASNCSVINCVITNNSNNGIYVGRDSQSNSIISCNISNNDGWGIHLSDNSNSIVNDCTVNNNSDGIYIEGTSGSIINNSLVSSNSNYGIRFQAGSGSVIYSTITGNNNIGLFYQSSSGLLQYCDLYDNANYDIKMFYSSNLDATNCYWGTMDTDVIDAHIWDYYDDFDLGKVIYAPIRDTPLAVTLASVTATTTPNSVTIKWRTESEINNIGFSMYRSESKDGNYTKIGFVSGAGNSAMPTDYQFIDKSVEAGKTYFYYIEDIDVAGERKKSKIIKVVVPAKSVMPIPKEFALLQNYPNPFNPETWISFKLAQDTPVTISIYDLKGQLIRTISLGNKNAGIYTTKDRAGYWDGRDSLGEKVASGMYYYTLQAGEFRATRKMVVVK